MIKFQSSVSKFLLVFIFLYASTTPTNLPAQHLAQAGITDLTACADMTMTDLYDSDGWSYGVDYYANNTCNDRPICFYTRTTIADNVTGSVHPGPLLLQANERYIKLGGFVSSDGKSAWKVNVKYMADDSCY